MDRRIIKLKEEEEEEKARKEETKGTRNYDIIKSQLTGWEIFFLFFFLFFEIAFRVNGGDDDSGGQLRDNERALHSKSFLFLFYFILFYFILFVCVCACWLVSWGRGKEVGGSWAIKNTWKMFLFFLPSSFIPSARLVFGPRLLLVIIFIFDWKDLFPWWRPFFVVMWNVLIEVSRNCELSRRPSTRLVSFSIIKEMREWNVKKTLEWRAKLTVWCFEMAITSGRRVWQKKTAASE